MLDAWEIILFNTYIQFNGCISYKYREYQWVVMHPFLLPIYTYYGANVAICLQ